MSRFVHAVLSTALIFGITAYAEDTPDFAKAVERYRARIGKAPKDLNLHREMIAQARDAGQLDVPLAVYKAAYAKQPDNSIVRYVLAYTLLMDGSAEALAEAETLLQQTVQKHPEFADAHLALGLCYVQQEKLDAARVPLEKSVELNPSSWEAHLALGNLHASKNDYATAVEHYQRAATLEPKHAEIQYRLGVAYRKLNRIELAREAFLAAIGIDDDHAEAHYQLGQVYALENQPELALKHYEKASKLDGGNTMAYYELAHIFLNQGQAAHAISVVQQALALDTAYADYTSLLSGADAPRAAEILARILDERPNNAALQHFTGKLFLDLDKPSEAQKHLEQASALDPNDAEIHLTLGQLYATTSPEAAIGAYKQAAEHGSTDLQMLLKLAETYHTAGDFQRFEDVALQILAMDDRQAKIHYQLANVYDQQAKRKQMAGESEEAKRLAKRAIEHADKASLLEPNNVEYLLRLADLNAEAGQIKALRFYDEAIGLDPQNAEAYYRRGAFMSNYTFGDAKLLLYDPTDVLDDLKQAIALDPNLAGAHYALGVAYDRMDDVEAAMASFQRAAELDPSDPRPHLYLGEKYANSGQPLRAVAMFAKAVKADPENVEALKDYAYLSLAHDEERGWKQAKRALETAIKIRPNDPEILMNYGYTLFLSREYQAAIGRYRRALELKPNWGLCLYNLGVAHERIGQKDQALAAYQKAVQADREGMHYEKALERIEILSDNK